MAAIFPTTERHAIALGISGDLALLASGVDAADFQVVAPFPFRIQGLHCSTRVAPSGPLSVQLRRAPANGNPPVFADVAGLDAVFAVGHRQASVDVFPGVDVAKGDLLSLTVSNLSGTNLIAEAVGDRL